IAHEVASMLGRVKRGAFELYMEGLTSFGGRKPRAVVASVAPAQSLLDVQAEHERLMQRIGLEPEGRKFTPHVTLARLRESSSQEVAEYLSARGYFRTSPFRVSRFVLFSSRASVGGGPYVVEAGYPLSNGRHAGLSSLDCTSRTTVATLWASVTISRINDSKVKRGGSTSPTTLPKSSLRWASDCLANCCIRGLSARQCMRNILIPRLRALKSVRSSRTVPTP